MRHPSHWRLRGGIGALAGALVLSASGFATPAFAVQPSQTGPVSTTPATGTPALTAGPLEFIRELKQCGDTVYAVGTFTSITQDGSVYTRDNVFSFDATAPYTMTAWDPDVNGTVSTIAFDGGNCAEAYIGGSFTSVDGTSVENLAELSTTTGAVNPAFAHTANAQVYTMAVTGSHLLTGGAFTSINGTPRFYYASLNITTGKDDGYLHLDIGGTYEYSGVQHNTTHVYNQQISHGGARVLVEGVFTSVGGKPRQQIFQMFLGSPTATVTDWTSPEFSTHCVTTEPFYIYSAAWSPTDNTVYTVSTGTHPYLWPNTYPLYGDCDAAVAYSANEESVNPEWTNYTGCDSLYSVVADDSAVYVGGHPRWSENPNGCNDEGPGAIPDPGMQGLSPSNGSTLLNSDGTALYTMARANAYDMMITSTGLWIASTNRFGADTCNGVSGLAGICFLPYSS